MLATLQKHFGRNLNRRYKRVRHCIVELELKDGTRKVQTNEDRKGVKDKRFAKFRCNFAYVTAIFDMKEQKSVKEVFNQRYKLHYVVNDWVQADEWWPEDFDEICTHGIHYFCFMEAAYFYVQLDGAIYPDQFEVEFGENGSLLVFQSTLNDPKYAFLLEC